MASPPPSPPSSPSPSSPAQRPAHSQVIVSPAGSSSQQQIPVFRNAWPWVVLFCFAIACGCGLTVFIVNKISNFASSVVRAPSEAVHSLAGAFQPKVNVTTTISSAIGDLQHSQKLVILTTAVDAQVAKERATEWGYIYWGTTTVTLKANDNRVQFYIPTGKFSEADFRFDKDTKSLILTVPPPVLDTELVEVQTDPAKIQVRTSLGWSHIDRWTGDPLRQEAQRDLRPAVLEAAKHPLIRDEARRSAREHIEKLLTPMAEKLMPGVKLEVRFADEKAEQ